MDLDVELSTNLKGVEQMLVNLLKSWKLPGDDLVGSLYHAGIR